MDAYETALLLFSQGHVPGRQKAIIAEQTSLDDLLDLLLVKSYYCGIVQHYRSHFQFSVGAGLSITFDTNDQDTAELQYAKKLGLLVCGIAALQAFVQANWTGPAVEVDVKDVFTNASDASEQAAASTSTSGKDASVWTEEAISSKCIEDLSMAGEPAYHLIRKAGYLLLARHIFALPLFQAQPAVPSIHVWQMRAGLVNLRLLDTPVGLSDELLEIVDDFTTGLTNTTPTEGDLKASLLLLQGVYHAQFVQVSSNATKISNDYFYKAAQCTSLKYELTGRMGKRTKWQIDEKSQLVVLAKSRSDRDDGWEPREKMALAPEKSSAMQNGTAGQDGHVAVSIAVPEGGAQEGQSSATGPRALDLNDDTLLERTHFTSSADEVTGNDATLLSIDPNHQPILHPLDECILLALSLVITNTSPTHGLTTIQIQSFVARILEDGSQNWSIFSMGLLLRSRLEANRTRTVERGLLQIQSLVDQLKLESIAKPKNENDLDLEKGASPNERLKYFYQLSLPSIWELEKELATRFLGLGVVRSALEIFTRMEMWEEVARCHTAVGEEDKAIKIVEDLLQGRILESESTMSSRRTATNGIDSNDTRATKLSRGQKVKLWCLLGDLKRDPELYRTAWDVSGKTSSRAMQSLGRIHFVAGEYAEARDCLVTALAINPLNGKLWFILGCAAMRVEDWENAEKAFRRCTSIEDDDGESWNNLATVILKQAELDLPNAKKEPRQDDEEDVEPTEDVKDQVFERKRLAFTCLRQSIRYSYDSWRIWANYLLVAIDVGEYMEACRALGRLAELRADKDGTAAIDLDALDVLVQIVARDAVIAKTGETPIASSTDDIEQHRGLAGRVKSLFENALLPRITDSARVYTSYGRLLFALGDYQGAIQAHLKAYRVDVVQNDAVGTSRPDFERAASRVHETIDMMRNLGDRSMGDQNVLPTWKTQARSMVRTFLGRTKELFGEETEWEQLQQELQELKL